MTLVSQVVFWLVMAAVATAGLLAPWGRTAKAVIFSQADLQNKTPAFVFAELYFFCLCMTSPLALIFSAVSSVASR